MPQDDPSPGLVIALSGRLLAEAARAAGATVDVADAFGDQDCRQAARHHRLLARSHRTLALDPEEVTDCVRAWARAHPQGWLLPGTGFEHQPELLAACAATLPVAANPAATVQAAKDPWVLARLCADLGLAFPTLRPDHDASPPAGAWLRKPVGGAGGQGILPWPAACPPGSGAGYLQRRLEGIPVSLLFLQGPQPGAFQGIAVHRQWTAPTVDQPFRFGGAVAWPDAPAALADRLQAAARGLGERLQLRGLNGLDGLWDGTRLWVLEVNPRPPLTLALQPRARQGCLLQAHMECHGLDPVRLARDGRARADWSRAATDQPVDRMQPHNPAAGTAPPLNPGIALVYASRSLSIPADFRFPPGCHDLPALPAVIPAGAPVCSVQVTDGGCEKLRTVSGYLRECLLSVAGVECASAL